MERILVRKFPSGDVEILINGPEQIVVVVVVVVAGQSLTIACLRNVYDIIDIHKILWGEAGELGGEAPLPPCR